MRKPVGRSLITSLGTLFVAAMLLACGDDSAPRTDAGPSEAGPGTDAGKSVVRFASAAFEASELDAEATVTAVLEGQAAGEVSVKYATADDSATAGEDYAEAAGTLTWADGESGAKTFKVALTPDFLSSEDKQLKLSLSDVTGAAELGDPSAATLKLKNEACEEIHDSFAEDATLDGRCYLVTARVGVQSGATLTISPGVTLIFQQDTRLTVQPDSRLVAEGTQDKPIRFTGEQQTPGYWIGLVFSAGATGPTSTLAHATVEYAGSDAYQPGNVAVLNGSTAAIDDCTLAHSEQHGAWISDDSVLESFSGNTITNNQGPPVHIYAANAGMLDASSSYTGNAEDVVIVANYGSHANVAVDQTWQALDVPYLVTDPVGVGAKLTLAAGVTLQFDEDAKLTVDTTGALTAVGTADKPILLTGKQQTPGYWVGLSFLDSNDVNNKLQHVTVEYGGSDPYHPANIALQSRTRATIDDCTFRHSKDLGFWLSDEVLIDSFKNNTSTQNGGAAGHVYAATAGSLDETLKAQGNAQDHVVLDNYGSHANVTTAQTWPALDVPYLVTANVGVNAHLTIQAGATLVWQKGTKLSVSDGGALTAVGQAGTPVTFTSEDQAAGSWVGIVFWTKDSGNRLEHAVIEDGGADAYQPADVALLGTASASVKNCQLRNSSGHGIWVDAAASLDDSDNTFSDIAQDPVHRVEP